MQTPPNIDAVITWVDGNDPDHKAKRLAYQGKQTNLHTAATSDTRFDSQNEVYFCIASILKYAPFIRTIHVVTDNQSPVFLKRFSDEGLCAPDRIRLVDHCEIFRGHEDVLPTFNSNSIETMLWRIEGMAEHFVSFNDDFFINQPLSASDFFQDGLPVLHGQWEKPEINSFRNRKRELLQALGLKKTGIKPNFLIVQNRAALLAGMKDRYFRYGHCPRPLRRSVFSEYFNENPGVLKDQIQHRFRHSRQFTPPSLAYHLEISRFGVTPSQPASVAYFHPEESPSRTWFDDLRQEASKFGCIQSLDECPSDLAAEIQMALKTKFQSHLPACLHPECAEYQAADEANTVGISG
ncbi:Stealth CR1 domain-containing protein [Aliiroseovarius crassostreae]|uniref:Stealth CR1 domain-containing protein n=1 Tax=Aliiroseovarius crassostreae TaxID=154981 RepID=UPI0022077A6E|nr:Stealth CR1 domain-containing protein [Aliiroseovarius crassostreae]UWQ08326.1 Stealth CR1 domain-containing protein [Aliiroseovarius crassostreae]